MPERENKNRIVKFNQVKSNLFSHEVLYRTTKDKDRDDKRDLHTNKKFTNMQIYTNVEPVNLFLYTYRNISHTRYFVFFSASLLDFLIGLK